MPRRPESELYEPVKRLFTDLGFEVKGEVGACDAVAVRGETLVAVELKPSFNLDVVLQAIERQKSADNVYIAVEAPRGKGANARRWDDIRKLCRRLELGLVGVSFSGRRGRAEIVCDPAEPVMRKDKRARLRLSQEFAGRSGDYNIGGTTKRARVTAYRERALKIAAYLAENGSDKPSVIRDRLAIQNAYAILHRNVYGWFMAEGGSRYGITERGRTGLREFVDVVKALDSKPLLTRDEEGALRLLVYMRENGPCTPSKARATGIPKADAYLSDCRFGWFVRLKRGLYAISDQGMEMLASGNQSRE